MNDVERNGFVKETVDRLINSEGTIEQNITTAMTILHVVIDAEMAKTTLTLSDIRVRKKKIAQAVASYLDADLDLDLFE